MATGFGATAAAPAGEEQEKTFYTYKIRGIDVHFPYQAYQAQVVYMAKVIEALQNGTNALLESPTGTGKTLCLLCATLAWRESVKAQLADMQPMDPTRPGSYQAPAAESAHLRFLAKLHSSDAAGQFHADPDATPAAGLSAPPGGFTGGLPSVIYSSRTHSQLAQVVRELRKTPYTVSAVVLASRTQLCLHPEVSKMPNSTANARCAALCNQDKCQWGRKWSAVSRDTTRLATLYRPTCDIEDLISIGKGEGTGEPYGPCPYYLSRAFAKDADLHLVPYNYLVDPKIRKGIKELNLDNRIVIVDEAHNIEQVCADSVSFEITAFSLQQAADEVGTVLEWYRKINDGDLDPPPSFSVTTAENLAILQKILQDLCDALDATLGPTPKADQEDVRPGSWPFEWLKKCKVEPGEGVDALVAEIQNVIKVSSERSTAAASVLGASRPSRNGPVALGRFLESLETMQRTAGCLYGTNAPIHTECRVHLCRQRVGGPDRIASTTRLALWCFSPGVAMQALVAEGTRNLVLTSGTLAPLSSFSYELRVPFDVTLENEHVIEGSQVWAGVVSTGPLGGRLNSSYNTRDSAEYKRNLGNAIVNFCRIVPDGVLVFFPSYGVMNACLSFWRQDASADRSGTIMDRISRIKQPVEEPKDGALFAEVVERYRALLASPLPGTTGAVFFAVCRGKASEGLDFSDAAGRAVVVTGIPFAMIKDPKVRIKMEMLTRAAADRNGAPERRALSGNDWYLLQALRAVNQAVGRVIRHRHDYGAILLCDERFADAPKRASVSKWLRPFLKSPEAFGRSAASLQRFFNALTQCPPGTAGGAGTAPGATVVTPFRVSRQRVRLRAGHSQSSESGAAKPSVPLDLTQIPGLSPTDRTAGAAGPSGQALNAPNGTKGSVGLLGLLGTGRQMNAVQVTAMGRDGAGASAGASASAGADGARWAGWGGLGAHGGAGAGTGLNPPMANEVTLDSTSLLPAATGEGGAGQRHRRLPGDKGARPSSTMPLGPGPAPAPAPPPLPPAAVREAQTRAFLSAAKTLLSKAELAAMMAVLRDFKDRRSTSASAVQRLVPLLRGKGDLLARFSLFVPEGERESYLVQVEAARARAAERERKESDERRDRLAAAAQGMGPLACGDIVDPAAEEMEQRELEKERARKEAYMYGIPLQKGEEESEYPRDAERDRDRDLDSRAEDFSYMDGDYLDMDHHHSEGGPSDTEGPAETETAVSGKDGSASEGARKGGSGRHSGQGSMQRKEPVVKQEGVRNAGPVGKQEAGRRMETKASTGVAGPRASQSTVELVPCMLPGSKVPIMVPKHLSAVPAQAPTASTSARPMYRAPLNTNALRHRTWPPAPAPATAQRLLSGKNGAGTGGKGASDAGPGSARVEGFQSAVAGAGAKTGGGVADAPASDACAGSKAANGHESGGRVAGQKRRWEAEPEALTASTPASASSRVLGTAAGVTGSGGAGNSVAKGAGAGSGGAKATSGRCGLCRKPAAQAPHRGACGCVACLSCWSTALGGQSHSQGGSQGVRGKRCPMCGRGASVSGLRQVILAG